MLKDPVHPRTNTSDLHRLGATLQRAPDGVALQTRAGNVAGIGEVRIRDLVRNALRMLPTRIVVGEVRGVEANLGESAAGAPPPAR